MYVLLRATHYASEYPKTLPEAGHFDSHPADLMESSVLDARASFCRRVRLDSFGFRCGHRLLRPPARRRGL